MKTRKKQLRKKIFSGAWLLVAVLLAAPAVASPVLKEGVWQAKILRQDGAAIVFNFDVKEKNGKKVLYVINGAERLLVDSIDLKEDSVLIQMPFFQAGFRAKILDNGNLEGTYVKDYGKFTLTLPFTAAHGVSERFAARKKPAANITGRWAAAFDRGKGRIANLVGEFVQKGSRLTGTFLDPTGDYRYLEGVVDGDSLKLSAFDGGHVFLFTARIEGDHLTGGKFYSGASGLETWTAVKDATARIADGFDETVLNPDAGRLEFHFTDVLTGKDVSINDERFRGKVVVIQILGSWCPNCMDETKYLSTFYDKNRSRGVEIIGLAYERTTDFQASAKALEPFIRRFDVHYPVLATGVSVSDTLRAEKTLPQLKKIPAFPTTIFVDKKGNIRKVHTGYSGPATGVHYEAYQKEFNELISQLLSE